MEPGGRNQWQRVARRPGRTRSGSPTSPTGRFSSFEYAEHEVLDWIGFYNDERLREALDDVPPSEYYRLSIKTDNTAMVAAT